MVAVVGRTWQLAPSLVAMWQEANRIAPNRSRVSDGSIGDTAHSARRSDHNPSAGYVDALDLTHDPRGGFDVHAHVRNIAARRDPRVDYLISNGRIWSSDRAREGWRRYGGSNPHRAHAHVSIRDSGRHDTSPWFAAVVVLATKPTPIDPEPVEEDDVPLFVKRKSDGSHWEVNGAIAKHLDRPSRERKNQFSLFTTGKPIRWWEMNDAEWRDYMHGVIDSFTGDKVVGTRGRPAPDGY